ncbi:hypothetical protein MNBD_GAMMA16-978 [hydrothermal vent metagenome]|uniref:Uncharacterized protein n=1 Tax=hydrothermal vent metagenome TaxID=652676 RepID=A0A3B0ZLQ1_9ZZZZ
MRILPDNDVLVYTIRAHQPDKIIIGGGPILNNGKQGELASESSIKKVVPLQTLAHNFIITPRVLINDWPVQTIETLSSEHIKQIVALSPEMILLGTGNQLHWPSPHLLSESINNGIGIDIMTTAAACRTYNILTYEGRNVAAALIVN